MGLLEPMSLMNCSAEQISYESIASREQMETRGRSCGRASY